MEELRGILKTGVIKLGLAYKNKESTSGGTTNTEWLRLSSQDSAFTSTYQGRISVIKETT